MAQNKKNQKVSSSGLEENVAGALAYSIGMITGVIFLVIEPDNKFIRFHALQSIFANLAVVIIHWLLVFSIVGILVIPFFWLGAFIVWLTLMVRAYNHKEWELPYIGKFVRDQIK